MGGSSPLRVSRTDDGVVSLCLDNGPANLFDDAMWEAWDQALCDLVAAPPRAVLVHAEGPVVSTGVDVELFARLTPDRAAAYWRDRLRLTQRLERLPCPTVFAAHSLTLTAAFELALACDFIVATPSARFGLVERVVAFTPAMGGTQRLALRAGRTRAIQMIMQGTTPNAVTLHQWGVVSELFEATDFQRSARDFAGVLAAAPTVALGAAKQVLAVLADGGLAAADDALGDVVTATSATRDHARAVRAFLDEGPRHRTDFEGR